MINHDYVYKARIINVVDGDTLDMQVDLGFYTYIKHRFRLARIDTPELNSTDAEQRTKAKEAKAYVEQFNGQDVLIKSFKKDKYGRFLAEVYLLFEDVFLECLNDKLVTAGHAVIWRG